MNFMSKLYFGVFKRIGNVRLMFVISCIFAVLCFLVINSQNSNIYFHTYNDKTDISSLYSDINGYSYFSPIRKYSAEDLYKLEKFYIYRLCQTNQAQAFNVAAQWFPNVGKGKEYATAEVLCNKNPQKTGYSMHIYSFSYLWYYLWIIFWFYFPFLLVLPIRFIIDGYKQDKK